MGSATGLSHDVATAFTQANDERERARERGGREPQTEAGLFIIQSQKRHATTSAIVCSCGMSQQVWPTLTRRESPRACQDRVRTQEICLGAVCEEYRADGAEGGAKAVPPQRRHDGRDRREARKDSCDTARRGAWPPRGDPRCVGARRGVLCWALVPRPLGSTALARTGGDPAGSRAPHGHHAFCRGVWGAGFRG